MKEKNNVLYGLFVIIFTAILLYNLYLVINSFHYVKFVKEWGCGGNVGDCIGYGLNIVLGGATSLFFGISIMSKKLRSIKNLSIYLIIALVLSLFTCLYGLFAMPAR